MQAPDLDQGFMVNTYDSYNRFTTSIEAALLRRDSAGAGPESWSYLSARCRPEGISPDSIFNGRLYSFGVVAGTDGVHLVHMGSSEIPRGRSSKHYITPDISESQVHCPQAAVEVLDFNSALAALQTEYPDGRSRLHMRIDWLMGNSAYSLFAPCRYTNFPNPERDHAGLWIEKPSYPPHAHRYIQPISGPVLFHSGGIYHVAYVATHVTDSGTQRTEFSLWAPISFFDLRRGARGWRQSAAQFLSRTWFGRYFIVGEYHKNIAVDGVSTFYRYRQT